MKKAKMKPDLLVPFTNDGNMMHYDEYWREHKWVANQRWYGRLEYVGYEKGRSRVTLEFLDNETRRFFYMTLGELSECIPFMENGWLEGSFYFAKKGSSYTLVYDSAGDTNTPFMFEPVQ